MSGLSVYIVEQAIFLAGSLFALWKGGAAERMAAIVVIANFAIGTAIYWLVRNGQDSILLADDGLAAVALLAITVRYGAPWMGAVMLLYSVLFALKAFYLVTERAADNLFAAVNNLSWLAIVCCLIAGAAVTSRRRGRSPPAHTSQPAP